MSMVATQASDPAALDWLEHMAGNLIGAGRIWELQDRLGRGMLLEALRRTGANYTRAAQLLGVKRQAVQQMVLRYDLEEWAAALRGRDRRAQVTLVNVR
jgi:transcriptional regulator with GAF, ATPase, and Fis domain